MKFKSQIAFLLVSALLVEIFAFTHVSESKASTEYIVEGPVVNGDVTKWECIYFGSYPQSDSTGNAKEPIKWRVLSVDGNNAFLMADKNLDVCCYHQEAGEVTWKDSDMRQWLNSDFYNAAFSEKEREAVQKTNVVNSAKNPTYGTDAGEDTEDYVYLLSIAEAMNPSYGFASDGEMSETRVAYNTAYVSAGGHAGSDDMEPVGESDFWWLRSPGDDRFFVANAEYDGAINMFGIDACSDNFAVRPVLHLDLSKNVWTRAGIVASDGETVEIPYATPEPDRTPKPSLAPSFTESSLPTDDGMKDKDIKEKYVKEHKEYYQSSWKDDLVAMGSTSGLGFVLDDAEEDISDKLYGGLTLTVAYSDMISDILNFDFSSFVDVELGEGQAFSVNMPVGTLNDLSSSQYSVILYQLMSSDTVYKGLSETFSTTFEKNIKTISQKIANEYIKLQKSDNSASIENVGDAMVKAADAMQNADPRSAEFAAAYTDFKKFSNQYLDTKRTKEYLKRISDAAGDAFSFLGSIIDEFDTIGKAYQYACWAESYAETKDQFKEVLLALAEKAKETAKNLGMYDPLGEGNLTEPCSEASMCRGLSTSIKSYLKNMDSYSEDVHRSFAEQVIEGTENTTIDLVLGYLGDKVSDQIGLDAFVCPELAILNKVLSTGKTLLDLFTNVDDEFKMIFSVKALKTITKLTKEVSQIYGKALFLEKMISEGGKQEPIPIDIHYKNALCFDESIKIYKNSMLLAYEYATNYEKSKLVYSAKMSQGVPDFWYDMGVTTPWQKQANVSSVAISLLECQKKELSSICCHDRELDVMDPLPEPVEYQGIIRKTVVVACPVSVAIMDSGGKQVAYLSDDTVTVAAGYEPYFYVIPEQQGKENIKVAILPYTGDYQIKINGTGDGVMSVFVSKFDGENITDIETFANFPVTSKSIGCLTPNVSSTSLASLTWEDKLYGNDETIKQEDVKPGTVPNATVIPNDGTGSKTITTSSEEPAMASSVSAAPPITSFATKVKGVKLAAGKNRLIVKWKKVSGATGYQVQCSASKKFKKNSTKNVKKTSVTFKKRKKNKTYYFRVRAYKRSGRKTVYGKWSKIRKVKVK